MNEAAEKAINLAKLHELVCDGNLEEAKRWLDKDHGLVTKKDDCCRSLIHYASCAGLLPLVQLAVQAEKVPGNAEDDLGWTPLMCASSAGRVDVVRFLLTLPTVDVSHQNANGQNSLHYAASKGHTEVVKLLLSNGIDVNAVDKYGGTPLHRAAAQGRDSIVKALLEVPNIQVNIQDCEKNTPLHLACEELREDAAIAILHAGGNPMLRNKEDQRPVDLIPSLAFSIKLHAIYEKKQQKENKDKNEDMDEY